MNQTVYPYLLYEDPEAAVEFLTNTFGFREVDRMGSTTGLHVELEVAPGGGRIYLGGPRSGAAMVSIVVDDVDAHYARAVAAGAQIIKELRDESYARTYGAADHAGNEWYFNS